MQYKIEYSGTKEELFKIWWWVFSLNILSLGLYSFWGKTLLRQYLAQHCRLNDISFEYLGHAGSLCRGFFKALPIWLILILGFKFFEHTPYEDPYGVLLTLAVVYLSFVAIFGALRYRLTNVSWHGVRGHIRSSAWRFGLLGLWCSFVSVCSLGLMLGWMDHTLYQKKFNNIRFGKLSVIYSGAAKDLFKINLYTMLLAPCTLWLSRIWYVAKVRNYIYNHTCVGDFKVINTEDGKALVKLYVWGFFTTLLSLGILYPLVIQRKMQYIAQHFVLQGDLDELIVTIDQEKIMQSGEGLYTVLDEHTEIW